MTCRAHGAALVGTGWAISLLFNTNGCRNDSSAFVGASFLALAVDSFQSGKPFEFLLFANEWVQSRS